MVKKEYEKPEVEIVQFDTEEIMSFVPGTGGSMGFDEGVDEI